VWPVKDGRRSGDRSWAWPVPVGFWLAGGCWTARGGYACRSPGDGIVLLLGSFGVLASGAHRLLCLIVGALLMDACSQVVHVTNQAVIYDLVDAARFRVTTST
jgi:hypothetical protein